jgi:hypothetical protein
MFVNCAPVCSAPCLRAYPEPAMRPLPVLLCAAVAVLFITQSSTARSLVDPQTSVASVTGELPSFVSPGRLGAFLAAAREATRMPTARRTAAEALSAKFSDESAASAVSDRPVPSESVSNGGDRIPYIFEAALVEPSVFKRHSSFHYPEKYQRQGRHRKSTRTLASSDLTAARSTRRDHPPGNSQFRPSEPG